jgi:hypothetical protein
MPLKNKDRRSAGISLFVMVLGFAAVVIPIVAPESGMDWGYAAAFSGLIVGLTAFFAFLLFNSRARVFKRMFDNERILARFIYPKDFWEKIIKEEREESGAGKALGFFLGGLFLLIGLVMYLIQQNGLFLLMMLGLAVFFVIVGFLASRADRRRLDQALPEAVIAPEGVFYNNILHTWNVRMTSYLESVSMHPDEPDTLLFVIRQLAGGGSYYIPHFRPGRLSIPIPPGQEQAAYHIISYFNLPPRDKNN